MAPSLPTGILPIEGLGNSPFFTYALPWLLTFAIVYGFLEHYKVPKSKSARGVISIVLAFFVMPVAGPVMAFLRSMGAGLIVAVTGIIFFLVLLELTQTKKGGEVAEHPEHGKITTQEESTRIIDAHPKTFGAIVLIILGVIFWSAGGLNVMGIGSSLPQINWVTVFFLVILVVAIWWMISEEEEREKRGG